MWSYTFNDFNFETRFILALPLGSRFCANVSDGCNKKQSFLQQDFQIHFKVTRKSFKFILGLAWGSIKDYKVGNFVTNLKFKDQTFRHFLIKFCGFDPNFDRNILTSLYLKFETSLHVQLRDHLFIHTTYRFHDMSSVGNLHWGYLVGSIGSVINVVAWPFLETLSGVQLFHRNVNLCIFWHNKYGKRIYRTKYIFRKSHVIKLIKSLTNFIYQSVLPM